MDSFNRYQNAPDDSDNGIRMPEDVLGGNSAKLNLGELIGQFEEHTRSDISARMYPWATRFVLGLPLPSFQRPVVWTQAQKVRFIQSLWAGVEPGSYLTNGAWEEVTTDGVRHARLNSDVLLDGQQRLTSIEEYITGKFPVADVSGTPRFWNDLGRIERRRFCALTFVRVTIKTYDERLLRLAYDLRAFGGTAHSEDQRALPPGDSLNI